MKAPSLSQNSAFSFVEVTMAVGIIAFAAILLYALLPTGIAAVRGGTLEESATDIVASAAADLRRVESGQSTSPIYQLPALTSTPVASTRFLDKNGTLLPGMTGATFRLDFTPYTNPNPQLAVWHLAVLWPAQAAEPNNMTEGIVVLNRP